MTTAKITSTSKTLMKKKKADESEQDTKKKENDALLLDKITQSDQKCSLCWSELDNPASTPCGHLFCWDCIFEWHRIRSECPLCRQPTQMSQILPVYHY